MSQLRLLSRLPASISSDAERASPLRRMVIWLTLLTYLGQPLLVTAQIIADQNAAANKRPLVDVTANGLPLVQIATPSAAGVSHNQYTLFNVDPAGIILNNSQATVLTQQAGYVAANPNLANGAARIILNEVTSTNRSQLNGYTEVAGQPAEVIIANPNGITCNGCGFINTSRGVLTTGTPVLGTSGSLDAFRVTGGDIQIGTAGLNGSNLNQLDLISRSLQVNGQLWANNLNVITGANLANYNTLGMQVIPGTGNKPTVGIDVALLGGMYANKIKMVGTEVGVGVNSLGTLAAQAGDFILDNQGLITLAGNTTASGNLSVSSATAVTSSGTLAAQGNLTLNAASLNSTGTLAAGINSTGAATGNLSITTQAQTLATGRNLSGGDLSITASNINLANSSTQARNNVTLAATANIDHSNAQTLAGQDLNLSAATLIGNGRLIAGRDANLNLQGNYTNTVGNVIKANRNLALSTTGILTNQTALEAVGNLTLTAASLDNQIAATLNASNTTLNSAASITNAGRITGNNVNSTSASFSNTGSVMGNVITLNAGSLDNTGAAAFIGATQQLNLAIANSLSNKDGATLYSLGDVNIGANLAINPATGYLLGNTSSVLNSSATIEASGNLRIAANTLTNQRSVWGVMWGNTTAGAFVQGVSSYGGQGTPSYTPYFATEQFTAATTPAAQLLSGKNMLISGGMVTNTYSNMIAGAALTTQLTAPINNIGAAFITRETRVGQYNDFVMVQTGWTCNGWLCLSQSPTYGWVLNPLQYSKIIDTNASASNFTQAANTNPAIPVKPTTGNPVSVDASSAAVQAGALTLPTSGLYSINTQPGQKYLVVTDPRFTSYQNFMSSDYMFGRLSLDPQLMQKRLGDGFYEQKLINEQIAAQTGRRYLGDFSDAQTQFIALLDAGVKAAQDFQLSVGIALTPKQIDALSQDLVWMVEREVTLPNGKVERVLAPQLYLSRLHQADLKPSGALIAANSINLNSTGDINNSGSIASKNSTVLSAHDIRNQGGVIGSEGLTLLNADNDIFNLSGNINGKDVSLTAGRDIINQRTSQTVTHSMVSPAGTGLFGFPSVTQTTSGTELGLDAGITAGNNLLIKAGRDLSILGATVSSGADAALLAGRNINVGVVTSTTTANTSRYAASRSEITQLGSALTTAGNLQMQAGKDLTLTAAQLDVGKDASLNAGGNLTLAAAKNSRALSFDTGMMQKNSYDETVQGTHLNAGGNVSLTALTAQATAQTPAPSSSNGVTDTRRAVSENRPQAVGDITLQSAHISSKGGAIAVQASGDVNLLGSDEQHHSYQQTRVASSGFLSSTTTTTRDETNRSLAVGSSLDGNSISIQSGKDINVVGSDVVATQNVTLNAGNNLNIIAAQNSQTSSTYKDEQTSGLYGNGGASVSLGKKQQTDTQTTTSITHNASTVGSINGNVSLTAGKVYTQTGSDVVTPQGNIDIAAQTVLINEAQNTGSTVTTSKYKQSGITASLSSPLLSAAQSAKQMDQAASQTSSGRMKLLAAANDVMSLNSTLNSLGKGDTLANKAGVSLNVSLGNSSNESTSTQSWSQGMSSNVKAGGNVNIRATGAGKQSDLTVQGSNIKAGNDTSLEADNAINLLASQNTSTQTSTNHSSSNSVGAGYSTGNGFTVNLAASRGRGNADGSDLSWTNSHVEAGNTLTLKSGGDTTLKGAVAKGKQVIADVGGNLTIQSLQDTSTYASSQQNVGISVAIPIAGSGSVSGNYSKTNINSQYASVNEQTGIQAGDGGYAVKVKGDTTLVGGVIAASDKAIADNKLAFVSDGKVTQSDIQNQADYTANAVSVSAGAGGQVSASGGTGKDSGHASSITKSGIGISTKADSTGAIKPIFNAAKVNANLNAQVAITQSFSQQAPKAVGDYATSKLNEANTLRQQAKAETDPTKKTELTQQAKALDANWREGGAARVALHTAVGALSGGLAGAAGAGTSALTVPLIAAQINKLDVPPEVKQALILAAGTAVGGVTGGTAGAAAGLGQTGNNYLLHQAAAPQKSEAERYADAKKSCASGDSRACQAKADWEMLSLSLDNQVANLCNGGVDTCNSQIHTALANGSHLAWTPDGKMYVVSPESPPALTAPDTLNPRDGTFHQSASTNLSQSLSIAGVAVVPEVAAMLGAGKIVTGAALGAGFDAAGQYAQIKPDEAYRPWQTAIAGVTGAIAYPMSGGSVLGDVFLGGATNATNTLITNEMYGKNDSVMSAAVLGAGFGGLGNIVGSWLQSSAFNRLPTNVGATYLNPNVPLFQQTINLGVSNPYPALIGAGVTNTIGGIPSFIQLPEVKGNGK